MRGHRFHEFEPPDTRLRTWLYAASVQNHGNRFVQNLEVSPEGPTSDVFEIERQSALKRWITTRRNLPKPCKPWRNIQTLQIAQVVALEIVKRMRPWPYQAHFAAHYVPELR